MRAATVTGMQYAYCTTQARAVHNSCIKRSLLDQSRGWAVCTRRESARHDCTRGQLTLQPTPG